MLKVTGLFTPEKGSMLSRFTIKDTVFLLFCSMPVVWLLTYAFAYYFYSQIKKSDDPIFKMVLLLDIDIITVLCDDRSERREQP